MFDRDWGVNSTETWGALTAGMFSLSANGVLCVDPLCAICSLGILVPFANHVTGAN